MTSELKVPIVKSLIRFSTLFLIMAFAFFSCKKEKNASSSGRNAVVSPPPDSGHVAETELIFIKPLSIWRLRTAAAAAGGKILFAGGISVDYNGDIDSFFSRVDIYDIPTQTWSTAELSQARYNIAAASAGNKIVFAGGETATGITTRVDIYDVVANSWTTAELSEARQNMAAGSSHDKIFFAGGGDEDPWSFSGTVSKRVDIYDVSQNAWSVTTLSEARTGIISGAAGTKIVFAGGWNGSSQSGVVDIYDTATNAWSTASLSQAKVVTAATSIGDTIFFVRYFGAETHASISSYSDQVDKYDASSGNWSIDSLTSVDSMSVYSNDFVGAATLGNFAVFVPAEIHNFVFYNAVTGTWTVTHQPALFGWETTIISANNQIYIANWDGVWRVQF